MFTLLCGLGCLAAGGVITRHTGVPSQTWITALGLMLIAYVPVLLFTSVRPYRWLVMTIITFDWLYVAIVSAWLVLNGQRADLLGVTLAVVSTSLVAMFAVLQQHGLTPQNSDA